MNPATIDLDRTSATPLAAQIEASIRASIANGGLPVGARLPSWRDLAVQLGVARGTVRDAYSRLAAEELIVAKGAAGTRVVAVPSRPDHSPILAAPPLLPSLFSPFGMTPLPLQMGAPSPDALPGKLWSRLLVQAARRHAVQPQAQRDPRGEIELRVAIAAMMAVSRGVSCSPEQVIVTSGYANALAVTCAGLRLSGAKAWMEDPGYPLTRWALALAGLTPIPAPVDIYGIDVAAACELAPDARLAVVTASQQAPLGVTMSRDRREALLSWARAKDAWILEDDYLGELQLGSRAAPALAASDVGGRVLLAGTFSKTISPALRLGFIVAPPAVIEPISEAAACMTPVGGPVEQRATATFLAEGHYLRHVRRLKLLYAKKQAALISALQPLLDPRVRLGTEGGLAVRLEFCPLVDDVAIARHALTLGLAPAAVSPWSWVGDRRGLMLGVATVRLSTLDRDAIVLTELIASSL